MPLGSWPLPEDVARDVLRSVIRILGSSRRYPGTFFRYPSDNAPVAVKAYLKVVAQGRCEEDLLIERVSQTMASVAPQWLLNTSPVKSTLRLVSPLDSETVDLHQLRARPSAHLGWRLLCDRVQLVEARGEGPRSGRERLLLVVGRPASSSPSCA